VVDYLPSKHKALSSSPNTEKKKKKNEKKAKEISQPELGIPGTLFLRRS
jgi:hypothetical protein